MEELKKLSNETGISSMERLASLFISRGHGKQYSMQQVRSMANKVLQSKEGSQVLKYPQSASGGRVHASAPNEVWQVDTASMVGYQGSKSHFICCVDVFTRFTRAEALNAASAKECKEAFEDFGILPRIVDSDQGPEYKGVFDDFLRGKGVAHRVKSPQDVNGLATVDRRIQMIKQAISRRQIESGKGDWVKILQDVVDGMNEAPTEGLGGKAPVEAGTEEAIFDLQKANALKAGENEDKQQEQKRKIMQTGSVRQLISVKEPEAHTLGPKRRSFLPTYSGEVQKLEDKSFYNSRGEPDK